MSGTCATCYWWDIYYGTRKNWQRDPTSGVDWKFAECRNPEFPVGFNATERPETDADFGCTLHELASNRAAPVLKDEGAEP